MKTSDIKIMFERADKEFPIQSGKKEQTFEKMSLELERQKHPVERINSILINQFLYIDKSVLYVYGALICLEFIVVIGLQSMGIDTKMMISCCMVWSGIFSVTSIILIDKLFFGRMAELGASCYFNTKQSVAAYMIAVEGINLIMLMVIALYVGAYWEISIIQLMIYLMTPFLLSNVAAFGILSTETGRNSPFLLFASGMFLSAIYMMVSVIPNVFVLSSIGIWGIICFIMIILFSFEVRYFFIKVEKGELLCMN
ncbi:MAG: hypothetical protein PHW34_10095 [Hespellia sp.]|nr:hypothetical protein [Hespellia sp.]